MTDLIGNPKWQPLLEEHWLKTPFHLKAPFEGSLFEPHWFLELLVKAKQTLTKNEPCKLLLFDTNGQCLDGRNKGSRLFTGLEDLLPTCADKDISCYFNQLAANPRFHNFGFFLREPQFLHEQIWLRLKDIARFLFNYIPIPRENLGSDVFLGNYRETPFGAHKDNLDNFLFMVTGKKTLYLWEGHLKFEELTADNATAYELEAGDLLYWPSTYWHVGKNFDNQPSISINLDYYDSKAASWETSEFMNSVGDISKMVSALFISPHQKEYFHNNVSSSNEIHLEERLAIINAAKQKLMTSLDSDLLEKQYKKAALQRQSAMYFRDPCQMRDQDLLESTSHLKKLSSDPILYQCEGSEVLVACNGFSKYFLNVPSVLSLINSFNNAKIGDSLALPVTHANVAHSNSRVEKALIEELLQFLYQTRAL
ncbi:MAG: cupin domain-containing protein [Pseudomonadales bacterium]|nr:cupin domain-containing protein [Pseudomonadales bacterium]